MVFSSLPFLFVFLPIVLFLNFIIPKRFRNALLLVASLFFYAWGEKLFVILMLISVFSNHFLCLLSDKYSDSHSSKKILIFAVILNLVLLALFKYAGFIIGNINHFLSILNVPNINRPDIHLPIGISFFTFQSLSYVIDVYRKDAAVQKSLTKTSLYISLFPQLIAGPIIRYHDLANQLEHRVITIKKFAYGIKRFAIGLGKKVLIADILAIAVDKIFDIPTHNLTTELAWVGAISFTLQIYFDFSGYSDMAIGLGRMFGFKFPENFRYPYTAKSIREFWLRWHISLSTWFKDYLYIPLGGNRISPVRTYLNLFTVFFLCGLWHGANWNYILWGILHGLFMVFERMGLSKFINKLWTPLQHLYAVFVLIILFIVFKIENVSDALLYLQAMFGFAKGDGIGYHLFYYIDNLIILTIICGIFGSTPVFSSLYIKLKDLSKTYDTVIVKSFKPLFQLSGVLSLLVLLIVCFMRLSAGSYTTFIYFRF